MLNKLKLGPKLIGGFVAVAIIAGIIGGIGYYSLKTVGDSANTLGKVELPECQINADYLSGSDSG